MIQPTLVIARARQRAVAVQPAWIASSLRSSQ
jgi:hypothetical protein